LICREIIAVAALDFGGGGGGEWDVGPASGSGEWDVGPKSPLLELAQHRAAVTGEGDRRAERNKRPG
jgi:hypothetical protein